MKVSLQDSLSLNWWVFTYVSCFSLHDPNPESPEAFTKRERRLLEPTSGFSYQIMSLLHNKDTTIFQLGLKNIKSKTF